MSIRVFVTGGTCDNQYNKIDGTLSFRETHIEDVLERGRCKLDVKVEVLMMMDSLDMNAPDRARIVEAFRSCAEPQVVITQAPTRWSRRHARSREAAWITLEVHSALEAVGLTAAVARVLTDAGIPSNVIAALHHGHLFAPVDRAGEALAALEGLAGPG